MDALFTYISEYYPTIALFIVGTIIGGFVVRYHIGIQTTRKKVEELHCKEHEKKLDELPVISKKVDELPCVEHSKKLDELPVISKKVDALPCVEHDKKLDELPVISKKVDALPCVEHDKKLDELPVISKKVDALPCVEHSEQLELTRRKLDMHTEKLDDMRGVLKDICKALVNKKIVDPITVLQKFSPYQLTGAGEKFLVASGGKECIDSNLDYFISELEKINPQTAYDAEENSYWVLMRHRENPFFNKIKDYVFLAPETVNFDGTELSASLINVVKAMGIYLRDKYFEVHPELLPEGYKEKI